jgi:hypothetical protein
VTQGPVQNDMHGMGPIGSGCWADATHVVLTGHIFMHVHTYQKDVVFAKVYQTFDHWQ